MATTVQSIIDFWESRATSTPLSTSELNTLVSELRIEINKLSITVPDAAKDAITLLYSDVMPDGTHSGAVAEALVNVNSPGKILTINQTEVYALLDSTDFQKALKGSAVQ